MTSPRAAMPTIALSTRTGDADRLHQLLPSASTSARWSAAPASASACTRTRGLAWGDQPRRRLQHRTNWLGYLLLAGGLFAAGGVVPPPGWKSSPASLRLLRTRDAGGDAAYLIACRLSAWPRVPSPRTPLPPAHAAARAATVRAGATNWSLMAAIIYVLMPDPSVTRPCWATCWSQRSPRPSHTSRPASAYSKRCSLPCSDSSLRRHRYSRPCWLPRLLLPRPPDGRGNAVPAVGSKGRTEMTAGAGVAPAVLVLTDARATRVCRPRPVVRARAGSPHRWRAPRRGRRGYRSLFPAVFPRDGAAR